MTIRLTTCHNKPPHVFLLTRNTETSGARTTQHAGQPGPRICICTNIYIRQLKASRECSSVPGSLLCLPKSRGEDNNEDKPTLEDIKRGREVFQQKRNELPPPSHRRKELVTRGKMRRLSMSAKSLSPLRPLTDAGRKEERKQGTP